MRSWDPLPEPTLVLQAAVPRDFGGHLVPGSRSPEARTLEAALAPLPEHQPHLPQLPPHWNWPLFTLSRSQTALISPIALNFKIAGEITVHFFLS